MVNFTDKPQFTLKEVIYVACVALSLAGIQGCNTYNVNILREEFHSAMALSGKDSEQLWDEIREIKAEKQVEKLSLRKLELDVTRILTEIKK